MNPKDSSYPTAEDLIAMRAEEEPVYYICEKLKVKEMGPYDHIVTKHEVRDFLKAGGTNRTEAEGIVKRAQVRITEEGQRASIRQTHQQGQSRSASE